MPVGDDVVDLDDPALALTHPRFAERVCDESERARIASAPDPHMLLWTLFAAKEAAFKAVSKRGRVPVFAHRRFSVAPDLEVVRYGSLELPLRIERGEGFVHAVAGARPSISIVEQAPAGAESSRAVRALVVRVLAVHLRVSAEDVRIDRPPRPDTYDGLGPPRVIVRGQPSPFDLSMSHDGRFVSFAAAAV